MAYLVGNFEEVDKSSLPGLGPIRVKVSYKDPKEIKGSSKVFFYKRGFMVSWLVESEKNQDSKAPQKGTNNRRDDKEEEEEEKQEEESDHYTPFLEDNKQGSQGQPPESSKQGEKGENNVVLLVMQIRSFLNMLLIQF